MCVCPQLLLYGTRVSACSITHTCLCVATVWEAERAAHAAALRSQREEYEAKVESVQRQLRFVTAELAQVSAKHVGYRNQVSITDGTTTDQCTHHQVAAEPHTLQQTDGRCPVGVLAR